MSSSTPEDHYQTLLSASRTLQLATLDRQNQPRASYAPFVYTPQPPRFYIFVSRLSGHTQDLLNQPQTSVLLIEDEQNAQQLFARTRASYQCIAIVVEPQTPLYETTLQQFTERFGSVMDILRGLSDFTLFQLQPQSGRFIMGFGQAFDLSGERMQTLIQIQP